MKQLLSCLLVTMFVFSPLTCLAEENVNSIEELTPPQ